MSTPQQYATVVCVLRGGGEYKAEHVVALRQQVARWWPTDAPLRFVALTDEVVEGVECRPLCCPLPALVNGWWAKMELFAPQHQDLGDLLYFDLDTMITGPLFGIASERELTLLEDFYSPQGVQSGMMLLPASVRPSMHDHWHRNAREIMRRFRGDGELLDSFWRRRARRWQHGYPVLSYKVHVRQRPRQEVPNGTVVVCFHGQPRPWRTKLWEKRQQ